MDEKQDVTAWWHCSICHVDAELETISDPRTAQPCPDCAEPMLERLPWGVAA